MRRSAVLGVVAVASFIILVQTLPSTASAQVQPPDGGIHPLIGDHCTGSPNCTMADGCPGTRECTNPPVWDPCQYTGSGTHSCSACNQTGTQACGASGPTGPCNVATLTQGCSSGNCTGGTQSCNNVPGGTWGACNFPATCSNICGTGTHSCQNGNWTACTATSTQACGGCSTGTQTCSNGAWGTCVLGAEVCNNCDDDGNGIVDDGIDCSPCGL